MVLISGVLTCIDSEANATVSRRLQDLHIAGDLVQLEVNEGSSVSENVFP